MGVCQLFLARTVSIYDLFSSTNLFYKPNMSFVNQHHNYS